MKRKITLNPEYRHLAPVISQIPNFFLLAGEYVHDGRNKIKVFDTEGMTLNVKRYRIPLFFNRLAYLYLRQPKAQRAYDYALKLRSMGVNTPTPVAYIVDQHKGLLEFSYFVSLQMNYSRRFYEFGTNELTEENIRILKQFGRYTAHLHEQGIYHRDYSPGNILFDVKGEETEFCLVDINRMYFGAVSLKKGCANFARLWGSPEMFRIIATAYAEARGADVATTCHLVLTARRKYWKKAIRKRPAQFPLEL